MLSFISTFQSKSLANFYLNTSHVIFYREIIWCRKGNIKHLNTSHVIFYQIATAHYIRVGTFKYISCYLLSMPGVGCDI